LQGFGHSELAEKAPCDGVRDAGDRDGEGCNDGLNGSIHVVETNTSTVNGTVGEITRDHPTGLLGLGF